jgi:hypothetical protein
MTASPEDKTTPLWQKVTAVVYVLAIAAEVVVFHSHLHADFIPFDNSHIAPNILASIIIVEVVTPFAALLWPPTRRRLHRFADRKLAVLRAHAEHQSKLVEEMHHLAHTGKEHPRVIARRAAGEHPTASHDASS